MKTRTRRRRGKGEGGMETGNQETMMCLPGRGGGGLQELKIIDKSVKNYE
jgi:hypothetical protein